MGKRNPRPLLVSERQIVPCSRLCGETEFEVGILGRERHDGRFDGRERKDARPRVRALRLVREYLYPASRARGEG